MSRYRVKRPVNLDEAETLANELEGIVWETALIMREVITECRWLRAHMVAMREQRNLLRNKLTKSGGHV